MKYKKNITEITSLLLMIFIITILLICPQKISEGITDGMMLCANVLIPSLFPFTVMAVLLIESGVLYKFYKGPFSFSIVVIILSIIGGYPVGAKIIAELQKKEIINDDFSENLLCVSINAGPAFIITVVGEKILHNTNLGILLFTAHILATFEMFLIIKPYKKQEIKKTVFNTQSFSESFVNAVTLSCASMISICSYVIIFSGLINMITALDFDTNLIISFFEITNAVIKNNNIYVISFFLGFSGICIIMQVLSIGKEYLTNPFKIFISRIFHGILSVINLKVLSTVFPVSTQTISNSINFTYKNVSQTALYSFLLIALSVFLIYTLQKKNYCGNIYKDIL